MHTITFEQTSESVGGFLLMEIDGISETECIKAFGRPGSDAYYEPESGYNGMSWNFVSSEGMMVSLYFRYGSPRIGGNYHMDATFLIEFLNKKYGWSIKGEGLDQDAYRAKMRAHSEIDNWVNS